MSAIERMLNRLEEKILVHSAEVTGQSWGENVDGARPFPSYQLVPVQASAFPAPSARGKQLGFALVLY